VNAIDLRGCESCADVVQQYPLFAGVVSVVIGGGTYAGLSAVMYGRINPVEVGLFAVIFSVCYVGVRYGLST
jgi:hypothetical protein